jgi:hypothetical protein
MRSQRPKASSPLVPAGSTQPDGRHDEVRTLEIRQRGLERGEALKMVFTDDDIIVLVAWKACWLAAPGEDEALSTPLSGAGA